MLLTSFAAHGLLGLDLYRAQDQEQGWYGTTDSELGTLSSINNQRKKEKRKKNAA